MSLTGSGPSGGGGSFGKNFWKRRSPFGRNNDGLNGGGGEGGSGANNGYGSGSGGKASGGGGRPFRGQGAGGASGGSPSIFSQLWQAYNDSLAKNPILTKACTSLFGFAIGDILAQKFLNNVPGSFDWARLARMASFGFLIHGTSGHFFYNFLDSLIPGQQLTAVAGKVAVDQLVWAPIFTALFLTYMGFAERKNKDQVVDKVKEQTMKGVKASWKVWPVAHAINFRFIPTSQRLLYINAIQIGYNMFLSILGSSK